MRFQAACAQTVQGDAELPNGVLAEGIGLTERDLAKILEDRLKPQPDRLLTVETELRNFAIVSYAVSLDTLRMIIPRERFESAEFKIDGRPQGLISAVMFEDVNFHASRLPSPRMSFAQTNYRAYVREPKSEEHAVWFFGTGLGSGWARVPRLLWQMPWHQGRYRVECDYDEAGKRYRKYSMVCESDRCSLDVELTDTGEPVRLTPGFSSLEEQTLVLSHPVDGYYMRRDARIGHYSVWHDLIPLTVGSAVQARFGLFETLGLITADSVPHSVLLCRSTGFKIHLPPRVVSRES